MKIFVTGTRGIPDIPGGVEKHCQELYPLITAQGHEVRLATRYDRQKWGKTAKGMLRLGEYLGGKFANEVIVISEVIAGIVRTRCGRESNLIYNGIPPVSALSQNR